MAAKKGSTPSGRTGRSTDDAGLPSAFGVSFRRIRVQPKVYMGGEPPTITALVLTCPSCTNESFYDMADLHLVLNTQRDCSPCGKSFDVPPLPCRDKDCDGIYERCGGQLKNYVAGGYQYEKDWHSRCNTCGLDREGFHPEVRCYSVVCSKCGKTLGDPTREE